jgi:antibiotic biosynthesis monooxygenase (ABM) superfamily enzyme
MNEVRGRWKPERVVIIEFPDMDALNAWYTAPEYQPLIKLRKECTSEMDMPVALEGAAKGKLRGPRPVLARRCRSRMSAVTVSFGG